MWAKAWSLRASPVAFQGGVFIGDVPRAAWNIRRNATRIQRGRAHDISNFASPYVLVLFWHDPPMVGPPKTLHDLRRVEAQVRVTCTSCKATEVWELDALIAEVTANGGNVDWRAARWSIKCPRHCASPRIQLLALPFGKARARRQASRHAVLNCSLQILREAAQRSARESVGSVEVRLALHVLRLFLREDQLLTAYWEAATAEPRHPWTSCHLPYRHIVQALIEAGEPVNIDNRS